VDNFFPHRRKREREEDNATLRLYASPRQARKRGKRKASSSPSLWARKKNMKPKKKSYLEIDLEKEVDKVFKKLQEIDNENMKPKKAEQHDEEEE